MSFDPYHGVFTHEPSGIPRRLRHPSRAAYPTRSHTGRALEIATVEVSGAIGPSCPKREGRAVSLPTSARVRVPALPRPRLDRWCETRQRPYSVATLGQERHSVAA